MVALIFNFFHNFLILYFRKKRKIFKCKTNFYLINRLLVCDCEVLWFKPIIGYRVITLLVNCSLYCLTSGILKFIVLNWLWMSNVTISNKLDLIRSTRLLKTVLKICLIFYFSGFRWWHPTEICLNGRGFFY